METNASTANRASNALLRRVLILSTLVSLAAADGWLASFGRQSGGKLYSHWGWMSVAWMLIGSATSIYFWRKVWPPNDRPRATRGEIVIASVVLVAPCLWWLTFPLWFLSGNDFRDVASGLVAAALVLSFGAWLLTRLVKAFEKSDAEDIKNLDATEPWTQADTGAKQDSSSDH